MAKQVPYRKDFDLVSVIELISTCILWGSVLVSVSTIVFFYLDIEQITGEKLVKILNSINCFLAVSYFISDIICNYLFQLAESKRRDDFFDNSLQTNLCEENSQEYFTNDNINPGIKKMGVNCFENSFFTKSIATAMLKPMVIKAITVFLLFLFLALFTDNRLLTIALQLALPYTIIQQTIRLFVFRNRVMAVCKHFQTIFSSTNKRKITQAIIHNVTSYEAALSWACIKLDSKLFNRMNGKLSEKWNKIKSKYNIA
ncbi:MAG: hypothetical protein K0B10_14005 [Vicingaceae bacterium]|nr:hypothetical protein [Vicingaceae bacterium]